MGMDAEHLGEWPYGNGEMAACIRAHDWAATPLSSVETWALSLRTAVDLTLGSPVATILLWGPAHIQIYNDHWRVMMDGKHPAALGQPTHECFPEIMDTTAPLYERAWRGEAVVFQDMLLPINRDGTLQQAWWNVHILPVRDGSGTIAGIFCTVIETTTSVFAEQERTAATVALRQSEERFRAFVTASADVVYRMSPDWSEMRQFDGRGFLADTPQPSGTWMDRYIHLDDQPMVQNAIEQAIRTKTIFELEHRVHRTDGTLGWTLSRAVPILDERGEITEWLGAASDVTNRRRSEAAQRESEERFAQFAASSSDALWIRDATTLAMEYISPAVQTIYGISPDAILGDVERWAALIVPEDRDIARKHLEQAQAGEAVTHEFRILHPADGEERWIKNTDFPLRDVDGRVQRIGGITEDVTEIMRAAKRQEVLVNELQHRARNLLGVVAAVADRTVKQGGSVEAFEERLQALSRAQGLLSQGNNDTVAVDALVRTELAAYADEASFRVTISGPEVHLRARQVQNFALALHELTTNAVKYGALKDGTGQLAVTWDVVLDRRQRRRLALNWIESEVAVRQDVAYRRGYGTELIQEALAYALRAEVDYTLGPDGVRCRIEMPVS